MDFKNFSAKAKKDLYEIEQKYIYWYLNHYFTEYEKIKYFENLIVSICGKKYIENLNKKLDKLCDKLF